MKARYWRLRLGNYYENNNTFIRTIKLLDVSNIDMTNQGTKTIMEGRPLSAGSANAFDSDPNTVWSPGWYGYTSYHTWYLAKGIEDSVTWDFGAPVDIRSCTITYKYSMDYTHFECSMDQNIWFCVGRTGPFYDNISAGVMTFNVPAKYTLPTKYFWGVKIQTHTIGAVTEAKVLSVNFRGDMNNDLPDFLTKWNLMYPYPWGFGFASLMPNGSINHITDPNNTNGVYVSQSANQRNYYNQPNPSTQDTWWGMQGNPYYNDQGAFPTVVWNNSGFVNTVNNMGAAAPAANFDQMFVKFDDTVPCKPTTLALGGCDTASFGINGSDRGYPKYQPFDLLDYIFVDNFAPYMATGLTVSGLWSGELVINGAEFIPDIIVPITTISPYPTLYSTIQTISLVMNEPGTSYYQLNGGSTIEYTGPFELDAPTLVTYWSVDAKGNVETQRSVTYIVDIITPVTTLSPPPGLYGEPINLVLTPSEASSVHYTINDGIDEIYTGPIPLSSNTIITFYAIDNAGHREITRAAKYAFDLIDPITFISPTPGLYRLPQTIVLTSSDPVIIYYSLDGGPDTLYSGPINITATTEIAYYSIDVAGNKEVTRTELYIIDQQLVIPSPAPGYFTEPQDVTLTATIPGTIKYKLTGV